MINYIKSVVLNNCTIDELKVRFKKFPHSGKYIIRICDNCGKEKKVIFNNHKDLCSLCGNKTIEKRRINSLAQKKRWEDPLEHEKQSHIQKERYENSKEREKQSERIKGIYRDHPEIYYERNKNNSNIMSEVWSHQKNRDKLSKYMKNSDIHKNSIVKFSNSDDMVNHHYIYDHEHPELYVIPVKRSFHPTLHMLLNITNNKPPHINTHIPWRHK